MAKTPRYYQRTCKDSLLLGWDFERCQLVKMPTASGKTFTVADTIKELLPARVLYLADQTELVQQPRAEIGRVTGVVPALEQAKNAADLRSKIVVASSQSLARESKKGSGCHPRLERFPEDHFQYIFADECHRGTDRDSVVWNYFKKAQVCGLTATPFRLNLADLSKWFGRIAYQMDILNFIEEGFAPPMIPLTLPVEIDIEAIKVKRGIDGKDFDPESVDTTIAPYYGKIADLIVEYAKGRHGIAYLPLIRSSEAFAAILRSKGLRAHHIDGNSDDRDALIEQFKEGRIDWLCNSNLLSTGVDIPIADCFLNLKLTHSRSFFQQARGRVMRVLPDLIDHLPEKEQAYERKEIIACSAKPNFLVFDLLLQNDTLGAVHAGDDFCQNEYDAKQLFERTKNDRSLMEIAAMAKQIQQERESALVEALERAAIRSTMGSPMTADQVAALLGNTEIIGYIPVERWEQEAATAKQIETLVHHGIEASSIKSKGQANQMITVISSRMGRGFCTIKQTKLLRQLSEFASPTDKIEHPELLSIGDASAAIDRMMKARRRPTI